MGSDANRDDRRMHRCRRRRDHDRWRQRQHLSGTLRTVHDDASDRFHRFFGEEPVAVGEVHPKARAQDLRPALARNAHRGDRVNAR
jgi:hypothetical protein